MTCFKCDKPIVSGDQVITYSRPHLILHINCAKDLCLNMLKTIEIFEEDQTIDK